MNEQLSLFDGQSERSSQQCDQWVLSIDGASRGNPGPSGAGVYITRNNADFLKQGFFVGNLTNNQAEYVALLLGLCQIKPIVHVHDDLLIISDSELLVRQISGLYAIKNRLLSILHAQSMSYLQGLKYRIIHVLRSQNKIADELANEGINHKRILPEELRLACSLPALT